MSDNQWLPAPLILKSGHAVHFAVWALVDFPLVLSVEVPVFGGKSRFWISDSKTLECQSYTYAHDCKLTSMYLRALCSNASVVSLSGRGTCCLRTSRQSRSWARLWVCVSAHNISKIEPTIKCLSLCISRVCVSCKHTNTQHIMYEMMYKITQYHW